MLTPHEVATLILVKDTPNHAELDRAALDALLEHQLVSLEESASGHQRPCITVRGGAFLSAVARMR
nr:hypothetical protein [Cupriavidus necator]